MVISVTPTPSTVTVQTTPQPTYAGYVVSVVNRSTNTLNKVHLEGTATVVGGTGTPIATYHSAIGLTCSTGSGGANTVTCSIGQLKSGAGSLFTVVYLAPKSGTSIVFSWTLWYAEGSGDNTGAAHIDFTSGTSTTTLGAVSTTQVISFVPTTGGSFYTGDGTATSSDPWVTLVSVPSLSNTAKVNERAAASSTEICGTGVVCATQVSELTIPGTFANLVITLRLDDSQIASSAKIEKAHVYYRPDATTANPNPTTIDVPNCTTPGELGPDPCISTRQEYKSRDASIDGDWEFVLLSSHNGNYRTGF